MSWTIRVPQENGRLAVTEIIFGPEPEAPEGGRVDRAEILLARPAGALFVRRALAAGLLDPTQADHVAVARRSIMTVMQLKGDMFFKQTMQSIRGVIKSFPEPINTRWSYDLNEFHHSYAERMLNYYRKAVVDTQNPPVQ